MFAKLWVFLTFQKSSKIEFFPLFIKTLTTSAFDKLSDFRAFDREGNGQITISDVQNILEKLGERLSGEESGAILGQFVDSEGRIEYEKMVNTILNDDSRPWKHLKNRRSKRGELNN